MKMTPRRYYTGIALEALLKNKRALHELDFTLIAALATHIADEVEWAHSLTDEELEEFLEERKVP